MSQPLQRRARVADVQPDAVAAQTHAPVELILVDDESTDDSVAVAVVQASGVPFKLLRQRNAGVSRARNAGLAAAQGETVSAPAEQAACCAPGCTLATRGRCCSG